MKPAEQAILENIGRVVNKIKRNAEDAQDSSTLDLANHAQTLIQELKANEAN